MERPIVIIPALNPLPTLINYTKALLELNIYKVIIVNDGSDPKYQYIFQELSMIEHCIVLKHEDNKGKGRALKTGFGYVLKYFPNTNFVLTVGAHGQHTLDDVKLILQNLRVFSNGIILGVRNFRSKDLPLSNAIGHRAASLLFKLLFHRRILDTQTGLRSIPTKELSWLLNVPGDSYDYDINMLVEAINRKTPIYEIPIGRVKIRKNSIIHYDEITNSQKIIQQIIANFTKYHKKNQE